MELTPQLLAEVEFRDTLRGYDRDEVDTFLEQVGVAIAQLQGRLREAIARAEVAESRAAGPDGEEVSTDTITRTLLLAQRTADATVAEAESDAARMVTEAQQDASRLRSEAEADRAAVLAETENEARQVAEEARRDLMVELERLETTRDQAQVAVTDLEAELDVQRTNLLTAAEHLTALAEGGALGEGLDLASDADHGDDPVDLIDLADEDTGSDQSADTDTDTLEADQPSEVAAAGGQQPDGDAIDLSDRGGPYDVEVAELDVDELDVDLSDDRESLPRPPEDPAPGASVFGDAAGPATAAVDVLALDDDEAVEADDVFVRQLRDAVGSDSEADGETMAEFFDDGDGPRRLFGRSSD